MTIYLSDWRSKSRYCVTVSSKIRGQFPFCVQLYGINALVDLKSKKNTQLLLWEGVRLWHRQKSKKKTLTVTQNPDFVKKLTKNAKIELIWG